MSIRLKTGLPAAALTALTIMLAGCDSTVITGPAAPAIGAAMAQPGLLSDGNFELGAASWEACSDSGNSQPDNDASEGELALQLGGGACRYQNLAADAGKSYQLTCDARQNADGWSSVTLAFLDQNFQPLDTREVAIQSDAYEVVDVKMTAPDFTSLTEVLFYSEGNMTVDNCNLSEITIEIPPVELQNGTFDDGLNNWSQCTAVDATADNGIASIAGGSCINQSVTVTGAVAASAANDPLTVNFQCDQITKADNQYAAAIVAFLDQDNAPLATAEQPINAGTTSTTVSLAAPSSAQTLEVTLYSDGQTSVGQCRLTAQ
jgi:hypothetical protein